MKADFSQAHEFTAQWEGGLSDHPADSGGLTNHGISLRWVQSLVALARKECLAAARSCDGCPAQSSPRCRAVQEYDLDMDGDVDADDIRRCTKAEAARLFKKHFWDALHCQSLPAPLAMVVYDSAVNMGAPRAITLLQQSCNTVGEALLDNFSPIAEDGCLGTRTRELAQALGEADLAAYTARHCIRLREKFYQRLASSRPSMKVFLQGWLKRSRALLHHIAQKERE